MAAAVGIVAAVAGAAAAEAAGSLIIGALVAAAIGFVGNVLFPPALPSFDMPSLDFDSSGGGRTQLVRQPISSWKIVYGECAVSGPMGFIHSKGTKNEYLYILSIIASHEIEEVLQIYLADTLVEVDENGEATNDPWVGYVTVRVHLGTEDQEADQLLIDETDGKWTEDHRLRGKAYAIIKLKYDDTVFPSGIPNPKFIVRGKNDIYDPRTETYGYTNNAALCILDYMTYSNVKGGYGAAMDRFSLSHWASQANISDEDVPLRKADPGDPQTYEARYTCNGVIDTADKPVEIIENLLTCCAGTMDFSGGLWNLYTGYYRLPTFTIDENMIIGDVSLRPRIARKDLVNQMKGTYISPKNAWQPADFPAVVSSELEERDGQTLIGEMTLQFTTSGATAQRLAKIALWRARYTTEMDVPCDLRALAWKVQDNGYVNLAEFGYEDEVHQIGKWMLSPEGTIQLTLKEEKASIYAWDPDTDEQLIPQAPDVDYPNFVDREPPAAVDDLATSVSGTTAALTWTNPADEDFFRYRVYRGTTTIYAEAVEIYLAVALPGSAGLYNDDNDGAGLDSGTYYYWIIAEDTSRNLSDPSNMGTAVIA